MAELLYCRLTGQNHSKKFAPRGIIFSHYTSRCELLLLQLGVNNAVSSLNLTQLTERFPTVSRTIPVNPAYDSKISAQSAKTYRGFDLKTLLQEILPAGDKFADYVLAVTALDGFDPVLNQDILTNLETAQATLAYQQGVSGVSADKITKDGSWEMVNAPWGKTSPAPFYIVWNKAEG